MATRPRPGVLALVQLLLGGLFASVAPAEGVALWLRVRGHEAAGLLSPPAIAFDGPALVSAIALGLASLLALVRGQERHPAPRLLAMLAILVVFTKLFVLPTTELPFDAPPANRIAQGAAVKLASTVSSALVGAEGPLPVELAAYQPALDELGPAPFVQRGERVGAYSLRLREGCTAPEPPPADARPGTLLLCFQEGRRAGWLTVQAVEGFAGPPGPARDEGGALFHVRVAAPDGSG